MQLCHSQPPPLCVRPGFLPGSIFPRVLETSRGPNDLCLQRLVTALLSGSLQVAIKVIDKKRAKKDTYVTKNLRREGQIQQMIRHPNITQLLDILETENSYYLVMELCPGGNLMHKIYEKKRLDEAEARRYIRQLISAVEHLHRAGVVHR